MLANVRQSFLDDSENLDLLVGCEPNVGIDLEIHFELSVGGQELDVAREGGVERCAAGGGGEREDREARFLLRCVGRLLQLGERFLLRCALLQHRRMRRDRKEVLRETVVNLPRDPRAFLCDGAPELREADRPPGAREEQAVREQPQRVAARDRPGGEHGREDVVERSEEHERGGECEPAVEVLATFVEALAEADDGEQVQECLRRERRR